MTAMLMGAVAAAAQSSCGEQSSQYDINQCYESNLRQADDELQATYDGLMKELGPQGRTRLRDAQRAWIKYKDNWCKFEPMFAEQGSMYPSILAQCLQRITSEQVIKLRYQLSCDEDVDCARFSGQ